MTVENFDRRLAAGIRWSFAGLLFFLPLLVSTRSSEVFELPKMLLVYAMTAVIVGLWLSRMVLRREILIRRTPLDIPILLFLLSQIVSTIYSIDPHVSWWGWHGRFHGGLWSTISYTLLYYALVANISENSENPESQRVRNPDNQKAGASGSLNLRFSDFSGSRSIPSVLIFAILSSALAVSVYAILQHFGVDKDFWVQDVVNRVFSTQGQPNWLAGYIVMTMPLAFVITNSKLKAQSSKLFSYGIIVILFLALLWTKSRSGLIGLAAADAAFWSLTFFQFYLLKKRGYIDQQRSFKKEPTFSGMKKLYRLSTIVHNLYNSVNSGDRDKNKISLVNLVKPFVLIHILMIGLILATNNPAREWIVSSGIAAPRLGGARNDGVTTNGPAMESGITLRKSEHGGTKSGDIRRIVWNGTIQLVKQRPIFGFGPETFGETYWRVRPKEHNLTSEWNFLYNKAHNEWLNLAANTGIFGLGSHLLLLGWFGVWTMRSSRAEGRQTSRSVAIPEIATAARGRPRSDVSTVILAALVGAEAVNFFGFSTVTVGMYRYLFMGIAVGSISDIRNKISDIKIHKSYMISYFLFFILATATLYFLSQLFIFSLADLAYNRGRAYQDGGYIEEAVEPLMRAVNLAPGEPVFRAELGEAEGTMASQVQSSKFKVQNENQTLVNELRNEAIKNLEIVRKQSPQNLEFIRTEAKVLFLLGNCQEFRSAGSLDSPTFGGVVRDDVNLCGQAVQLMKAAMAMAPTNPQLPYSLGLMLSKMGNEEEAALYYNKAVELKSDYND